MVPDGKRFLTIHEAAEVACTTTEVFLREAPSYGIRPERFMGTLLYRRVDIENAMTRSWRPDEERPQAMRASRDIAGAVALAHRAIQKAARHPEK
jgi:hypothetical protein